METAKRIKQLYICVHCGAPVKVLYIGDFEGSLFPPHILENCSACGHYGAIPLMHKSNIDMAKLLDMMIVPNLFVKETND